MAKVKKESYFWTSYSDLMTSLFFIMLVLFVLVIFMLHSRLVVTQDKLNKIEEIINSTKGLENDHFALDTINNKFKLLIPVEFSTKEYRVSTLPQQTQKELRNAGKELVDFINNNSQTQYVMIIEGQASRDGYYQNYELSFLRAKNLLEYWTRTCNLKFADNCEVQIAGSGDGTLDVTTVRESIESKNKRFLIYVLPKNIITDDK